MKLRGTRARRKRSFDCAETSLLRMTDFKKAADAARRTERDGYQLNICQ
jgi:hypothetical protein